MRDEDLGKRAAHRLRIKARLSATVAAAVALVGAGTGNSIAFSSNPGGAATPAGAVSALLHAAHNADILGALDALAPGERAALEPGLEGIMAQLKRLQLFAGGASLRGITGLSIDFKGIALHTHYLTSDVAAVSITSGRVTSKVDPTLLPLGPLVKALVGVALNGRAYTTTSSAASGTAAYATVEEGGRWYVSLGFSIAVNVLQALGDNPAPPSGPEVVHPRGASTPVGAVQDMFNSVADLDLPALLGDLAPDEMAAMNAYASEWLSDVQAAITSVKGRVSLQFAHLDLRAKAIAGGTLVRVGPGLTFGIKGTGLSASFAHGCYKIRYAGRTQGACAGTGENLFLNDLPPTLRAIFERLLGSHPRDGFVTVEEGGHWFVSPTRTLLQAAVALLSGFEPQDLITLFEYRSQLAAAIEKFLQQEAKQAPSRGNL